MQFGLSGARGQIILSSLPSRYTFQDPRFRYVLGLARYWHLSVHRFHPILQRPRKLNVVGDLAGAGLDGGRNDVGHCGIGKRHD